jgi:hypothetical protein
MEITTGLERLWKEKYQPLIYTRQDPNNPGQPPEELNRAQVLEQFVNENKTYPEKYRQRMATKFAVYLDPNALTQAPHMNREAEGGQAPSAEAMWYAQMNVWVQQDVARAISEMNTFRVDGGRTRPSHGVYESRVKHVKSITLGSGFDMYYTAASAAGASGATEDPAAAAAQTKQPKVYNASATGRACGPMYDVVHSTLTAVVAENAVEDLIRTLQSGRMVTVLQVSEIKKIDSTMAADLGYDYGPAPVVQVKIKCEHLFMRDWTARHPKDPMPAEVRKRLGVTDPSQQGTPAGGASPVASSR